MELHAHNRERLVAALRAHLSTSGRPLRGFVLLQGGEEQTRHCTDYEELFRQESYFAYLFGVRGAVLQCPLLQIKVERVNVRLVRDQQIWMISSQELNISLKS
jgi:hypothetical protein